MADLIDREALMKKIGQLPLDWEYGKAVSDICEIINAAPSLEAVIVPCKPGTHLWRITTPYRGEPKVTEFVVKNFRTTGKRRQLQIEVQALNVPGTNWMRYQDFYETREEAEAALAKMKEGAENGK